MKYTVIRTIEAECMDGILGAFFSITESFGSHYSRIKVLNKICDTEFNDVMYVGFKDPDLYDVDDCEISTSCINDLDGMPVIVKAEDKGQDSKVTVYMDIDRLKTVVHNGEIFKRHYSHVDGGTYFICDKPGTFAPDLDIYPNGSVKGISIFGEHYEIGYLVGNEVVKS